MPPRTIQAPTIFEVWSANTAATAMTLDVGAYGKNISFQMLSEETEFVCGDGLPGMAWATEAPVVLDRVRVSSFARAESARPLGLTAGIGLPVYFEGRVQSVLTLLTAHDARQFICEVWRPDEEKSELVLRDSFYGRFPGFRGVSRFPFGQGLPGLVWQSRSPFAMENLGGSPLFRRAQDAQREGLYMGVGFPVQTPNVSRVVLLLSSQQQPLFRACEIWKPASNGAAELVQGAYGMANDLSLAKDGEPSVAAEGIAAEVCRRGTPLVADDLSALEPQRASRAMDAGVTIGVGYPVYTAARLTSVVVLFC